MIDVVNERYLQIKSLLLTSADSDLQIKIDFKMILMLNTVLVFASLRIKEFAKAVDLAKKVINNIKYEEAETG